MSRIRIASSLALTTFAVSTTWLTGCEAPNVVEANPGQMDLMFTRQYQYGSSASGLLGSGVPAPKPFLRALTEPLCPSPTGAVWWREGEC